MTRAVFDLAAKASRPGAQVRVFWVVGALLAPACSESAADPAADPPAMSTNPAAVGPEVVMQPAGAGGASGSSDDTPAPAAPGTGGMSAMPAGNAAGASGGMPAFAELGVCGQRGESPVSMESFEGYEEFYLIGEDGFGEDICVVRFDVVRVGAGPGGCDDCTWTHEVEYRNPEVLTDVSGVCARSELGFDAAKIDEVEGSRAAYGFVPEYSGHVSVLVKYDDATGSWVPNGNANWNEETGWLRFDRRDGFCGY